MSYLSRRCSAVLAAATLLMLSACVTGPSSPEPPSPTAPPPTEATPTTAPAPLPVPELAPVPDDGDPHIWEPGAWKVLMFSGAEVDIAAQLPGGFDPGTGEPPVFFSITEVGFGTTWVRGTRVDGNVVVPLFAVGERIQSIGAVAVEGCGPLAVVPEQCARYGAASMPVTAEWITAPVPQVIVDGIPGRTEVVKAPNSSFEVTVGATNMSTFPPGSVAFLRVSYGSAGLGFYVDLPATDTVWTYTDSTGEATFRSAIALGCPGGVAVPSQCALVTEDSAPVRLVFDDGS